MTKDKPTQEEIKKCAKILLSRKSKTPWEGLTEWAKGTWLDMAEWHLIEIQTHLSTLTKELKDVNYFLSEKNETANTFMNQVKKLQAENATLIKQRDELKYWKDSMLKVESQWNIQEVGKEIGLEINQDIRPAILPAIKSLSGQVDQLRNELIIHHRGSDSIIKGLEKEIKDLRTQLELEQSKVARLVEAVKGIIENYHKSSHGMVSPTLVQTAEQIISSLPATPNLADQPLKCEGQANAIFIAHSRTDIPALPETVEELQKDKQPADLEYIKLRVAKSLFDKEASESSIKWNVDKRLWDNMDSVVHGMFLQRAEIHPDYFNAVIKELQRRIEGKDGVC